MPDNTKQAIQENAEAAKQKAVAAGQVVQEKAGELGDEIKKKEKEMYEPSLTEKAGQALDDAKTKVQDTFDAVTRKAKAAGQVAEEKATEVGDEIKKKEQATLCKCENGNCINGCSCRKAGNGTCQTGCSCGGSCRN